MKCYAVAHRGTRPHAPEPLIKNAINSNRDTLAACLAEISVLCVTANA